jgi:histone acetyltransferase (RNA polymerase elongator complex component)
MNRHFTIPIFLPEAGCKNRCVFCNQGSITGRNAQPADAEITDVIQNHLKTLPPDSTIEIGFFGGNFTGLTLCEQKRLLELVRPYRASGQIQSLRASTRPDNITSESLALLKEYGAGTIELGVQSTDDEVLSQCRRGYTRQTVAEASNRIKAAGFRLGLQMMLGLPGDTYDLALQTATDIVAFGADETRIYPVLVIKDTELARWYRDGKYAPLTPEDAALWAAGCLRIFDKSGVKVLRLGLLTGKTLSESLLAGPLHPAFGNLAYSALWAQSFEDLVPPGDAEEILVFTSPGQVNNAAGYRGANRHKLESRFKRVGFRADLALRGYEFYAHYR